MIIKEKGSARLLVFFIRLSSDVKKKESVKYHDIKDKIYFFGVLFPNERIAVIIE